MKRSSKQQRKTTRKSQQNLNPQLNLGRGNGQLSANWMPQRFRTPLRLSYTHEIPADSTPTLVLISGNGAQDPTGALSTQKPPGFALLSQIYTTYRVLGSRCEVRILADTDVKNTSTSGFEVHAAICPCISSTGLSTVDGVASQPGGQRGIGTGITPIRLSRVMSSSKMFGLKAPEATPGFWSLVTTVPAYEWFWAISAGSSTDMSTSNVIRLNIIVTYDVEWFHKYVAPITSLEDHWMVGYRMVCRALSETKTVRETLDGYVDVKSGGDVSPETTSTVAAHAAKTLTKISQTTAVGQQPGPAPSTPAPRLKLAGL